MCGPIRTLSFGEAFCRLYEVEKNFFLIMEESTRLKLLKSEEEKRTEFVNVRFTKNEIEMIETYVKKQSFHVRI